MAAPAEGARAAGRPATRGASGGRSLERALGRVALVLRGIGAVWMVVLAAVYGVAGLLAQPGLALAVVLGGAAWALLVWRAGWLAGPVAGRWPVLVADLVVAGLVVVVPAVGGESAGFTGGYPFAALVVGLAVGGRRGVCAAVAVMSTATVASLLLVGAAISPFVAGQLLLYVFSAVAMVLGVEVFAASESRAGRAEAELAVAEERATTAAHLHDSVLQTLALVQRRATDPDAVRALARRQERELRGWLFADRGASGDGAGGGGVDLADALADVAERAQADHGVAVRVVTAGGAGELVVPADERSGAAAVVAAVREAVANAAVHAQVPVVDVYAGLEGEVLEVFVRDRGLGFDLAAVPGDRQGIRGSIVDRVARAGGGAEVDTGSGRGTEVRIRLPVAASADGAVGQDGR